MSADSRSWAWCMRTDFRHFAQSVSQEVNTNSSRIFAQQVNQPEHSSIRTLRWASVISFWNNFGDRPVPTTWARPLPPPALRPVARLLQLLAGLAVAPMPLPRGGRAQ